jgi:hypothetical protein
MLQRLSTILLAALVLASCSVTRERSTFVSFASYADYPDLWISPNACPMGHTAIGQLSIDVTPAIGPSQRTRDGIYTTTQSGPSFERIGYDELLRMAAAEARARGANGISNLSITEDRAAGATYATAYHVTGLLIRIE